MIRVETEYSIAVDSKDHIYPWGTMRDNNSSFDFIKDVENLFGRKVSLLDLGCAGGQLVVDCHEIGNIAVGLEGSDYSIKHSHPNWEKYYNKILFTCDVTKPFSVLSDGKKMVFDCVTAWELLEHIRLNDLPQMLNNVLGHLGGVFIASVSTVSNIHPRFKEVELHETLMSKEEWMQILSEYFLIEDYPFLSTVRPDVWAAGTSFAFLARPKHVLSNSM